jgi:hypothetical protein
MPPRRKQHSLPNVLVVEPCQEIRQALVAALCELARALAGRVGVRLLGLVSEVGPEEIPGAASEGLGDEGTRDRPIPTLVLRLSGPEELTIGGRAWRLN